MKELLSENFKNIFGRTDARFFFAPGRVNLIGEHTDYNGGHVFPCALSLGTCAAVQKRDDRKLRFYSLNFEGEGIFESSLDDLVYDKKASWTNYPKGVIWAFKERGMVPDKGFDVIYYGNIPNGSGLSSSASIEVLTAFFIRSLYGFDVSDIELALIGQFSENKFNGLNCGIMDQFASAMGKTDHAIYLDTSTLNYSYFPLNLKDTEILIANTNVKHSLTSSKYNERRSECEQALLDLKKYCDISSLCDMTPDMFEKYKDKINDDICRNRAEHAVYENARTAAAAKALTDGNLELFGRLMNESHESLDVKYEVTCPELNILAKAQQDMPGVLGARMTGGGFGGCTVALVKKEAIDTVIKEVGKAYASSSGIKADFYIASAGSGPCEL